MYKLHTYISAYVDTWIHTYIHMYVKLLAKYTVAILSYVLIYQGKAIWKDFLFIFK